MSFCGHMAPGWWLPLMLLHGLHRPTPYTTCAHGFVLENRSRRTDQFGWWTSVAHKNTLASKTTVTEVHDSTHHLDEWICNQLTFAFIQMSKYGNVDGHRPTKNATNLSNMIDQLFNTRYHCTTGLIDTQKVLELHMHLILEHKSLINNFKLQGAFIHGDHQEILPICGWYFDWDNTEVAIDYFINSYARIDCIITKI